MIRLAYQHQCYYQFEFSNLCASVLVGGGVGYECVEPF